MSKIEKVKSNITSQLIQETVRRKSTSEVNIDDPNEAFEKLKPNDFIDLTIHNCINS